MTGTLRKATVVSIIACGAAFCSSCSAQSDDVNPAATTSLLHVADPSIDASNGDTGDQTTVRTTNLPVANDELQISKELDAMKDRIHQLEEELRAQQISDRLTTGALEPKFAIANSGAPALDIAGSRHALIQNAQDAQSAKTGTTPRPQAEIGAETTTKGAPFSEDWTWLNGNPRTKDTPLATKYFTPEFRADINYTLDYNHPKDDTLGGSTETFRSDEVQVEQLSFGGDFRIDNVRGRFLTMNGMFATTTPRNDGSVARGQWDLANAYRYVSEAWGGYHWDAAHGVNLDAGIFVSYMGLFSYYNFDNWTYQPSYVSSNTPWFFDGVRLQYFPTAHLKIEPWFVNGWQSYARFNGKPGLGGQILWRPKPWLSVVANNYGLGEDSLGNPDRSRLHTDDSVEVKYFDRPSSMLDKIAFSITGDLGCEFGDGVSCTGKGGNPKQAFLGWMGYNRFWFDKDKYAVTLGGGQLNNPGRYLALLPPINGATAVTGTPYFTENPGDKYHAYDATATFDYMPSQFITFRAEMGYRHTDVPYWTGRGGLTPPGGNNGSPADYACIGGASSGQTTLAAAELACGGPAGSSSDIWFPDLRQSQIVNTVAIMVKF